MKTSAKDFGLVVGP